FLVIWETTQACGLACRHCRASAVPDRHPDELTTQEAKRMLDRVREFGPIIFVFSGGDCMRRPDIVELVEYGARPGLRTAATPATTDPTDRPMREGPDAAGRARVAGALAGSHPGDHDACRPVR